MTNVGVNTMDTAFLMGEKTLPLIKRSEVAKNRKGEFFLYAGARKLGQLAMIVLLC
jgi:hypothetical protein